MNRLKALGIACALAIGTAALAEPSAAATGFRVVLPDITLAAAQNSVLPGSVANDRGIRLAGLGSDLWRDPNSLPGEFWMITDRGPNGQIPVAGANRRTFPVPEFTPLIVRVRVSSGGASIEEIIPIVGQSGAPVTGLSNRPGPDEVPWDWSALERVPYNVNGLDTEGLVRTSNGDFWLCDEYTPSIVRVDRGGRVVKRYVPAGVELPGADYAVANVLPGIFELRKGNRGFEALALSKDERTLYIALQSPLSNPTRAAGEASRNTRILAFDIASERVTGEWVYQFDVASQFERGAIPDDMKVSSMAWVNPWTLLVNERTDTVAKLYLVDLRAATNILDSAWDLPVTRPSLEQVVDLTGAGVVPLPKRFVVDLDTIPGMPDKIEGISILGPQLIAVANDNDFGLGTFDASGRLVSTGVPNQIILVWLDEPLPLQ